MSGDVNGDQIMATTARDFEPVAGAAALETTAFRQAVLKSERSRIIGVLIAIASIAVIVVARDLAAGFIRHIIVFVPFLAIIATYERVMLTAVNRAIKLDRDLWPGLRLLNVFLETQFPTIAMVLMGRVPALGPHGALVTPALLTYFFFIILSTLRLDPRLSVLTGVFSAIGYGGAAALALMSPQESVIAFPPVFYVSHVMVLLGGGFAAAAVTKQILGYLQGALREAELRRKIDKIEHELDIARNIQQGLLPRNAPNAGRFQIAGWNEPADQTGGDYYDWQELPDGKLAVTIADVTGHGIAPALVMAVCRAYARASFPANGCITKVMNLLNRLLVADLPSERFVTLAAVVLDPAASGIQILSAGHGPLLVYEAATHQVRQLNASGIPLGLISAIKYGAPEQFQMMSGDMMVMLTDGFFEWENASGNDFGIERVERFLMNNHRLTPEQIIKGLYTELLVFAAGSPQLDDLTAVVIKRVED
jgi:serine phosphatase RsbU (regulator of sigma subunit)